MDYRNKMTKKFIITNNIRRLRFFANEMTQLELAEKAFKIADVFDVPIGEVFECRPEGEDKHG